MKLKIRLIIAVVCWVGGLLSLFIGIIMGMMSQWAGWGGEGFLALGGALVVAGLVILLIGRRKPI